MNTKTEKIGNYSELLDMVKGSRVNQIDEGYEDPSLYYDEDDEDDEYLDYDVESLIEGQEYLDSERKEIECSVENKEFTDELFLKFIKMRLQLVYKYIPVDEFKKLPIDEQMCYIIFDCNAKTFDWLQSKMTTMSPLNMRGYIKDAIGNM